MQEHFSDISGNWGSNDARIPATQPAQWDLNEDHVKKSDLSSHLHTSGKEADVRNIELS